MTVIFVVATIILFLLIDWIYRLIKEKRYGIASAELLGESALEPYPVRAPEGIFFTQSHAWLNLFPSGRVRIGVDDFVGRMLEKPQVIFLKNVGDKIGKGDALLEIQEDGHTLTIRAPISGEVLSINEELIQHPEFMRTMLFSDGWVYGIRPTRHSDFKQFFIGTESRKWMHQEFARLRDFFSRMDTAESISPVMLQDGGPPIAGAMKKMDDAVWQKFEDEFLAVEQIERVQQ